MKIAWALLITVTLLWASSVNTGSPIFGFGSGATGGKLYQITACDSVAPINSTGAASYKIVAGVSSRSIRVCAALTEGNGTSNYEWVYGTGTTCGTNQVILTGNMHVAGSESHPIGNGIGELFKTAPGTDLCIVVSGAGDMAGFVSYAIY